jgi:hypothetical protein
MKIFIPKEAASTDQKWPIFLAGPVQGGGGWQEKACAMIESRLHDATVFVPCQIPRETRHLSTLASGIIIPRLLSWERKYLEYAACYGCVMFWLPCESKTNPRKEGPFARDTLGELGEWRGRLMGDNTLSVVVGAEEGFPGLDVIQRNFSLALNMDFSIWKSLEMTVAQACMSAVNNPKRQ